MQREKSGNKQSVFSFVRLTRYTVYKLAYFVTKAHRDRAHAL